MVDGLKGKILVTAVHMKDIYCGNSGRHQRLQNKGDIIRERWAG